MKKKYKTIFIICVTAGILSALLYFEIKSRTFQFFGGIVSCVNTSEKVVALTFDDGPSAYTEEVIAVLQKHHIKATFFLIGSELEKNREYGKLLADAGEEIGNHSYSHNRLIFKQYATIKNEIEKTDDIIRSVGYTNEILFRPPGCKKFVFLPYYLKQHNRKTITWNIEPETYLEPGMSSFQIADYTVNNIKPGSIILLHVMTKSADESRKSLDPIITNLQSKGYKFVTVSELLHYKVD